MTNKSLPTETVNCLGKRNIGKPDKYPPLGKPVKVLIKHLRGGIKRICCPYIDGVAGEPADEPNCNAYNCGRNGDITYTEHRLPLCPKVNPGDEASWGEAIDDASWDEDED